jgi:hypothetical protein
MIKALEDLRDSHNNLINEWHSFDGLDLNETESIKLYPFHMSFDDLNVTEWVEETLHEISRKARPGIWTPWAEVLCVICHGTKFPSGELSVDKLNEMMTPTYIEKDCGMTSCGKCGVAIQLDDQIAEEHNIVIRLKELGFDANMEQTGGMNSAASVYLDNGKTYDPEGDLQNPWIYITWNMDGCGEYVASMFDEQGEWVEDDKTDVQFKTWEEMLAHLQAQSLKKLEDN